MLRIVFLVSMWLAFPAVLWSAFEMYGLTLFGPQMLFFSIIHTAGGFVALLLASATIFIVWAIANAAAMLIPPLRAAMGLSHFMAAMFFLFQALHFAALFFYEQWSYVGVLRIAICLLGLAAVIGVTRLAVSVSRAPRPAGGSGSKQAS